MCQYQHRGQGQKTELTAGSYDTLAMFHGCRNGRIYREQHIRIVMDAIPQQLNVSCLLEGNSSDLFQRSNTFNLGKSNGYMYVKQAIPCFRV